MKRLLAVALIALLLGLQTGTSTVGVAAATSVRDTFGGVSFSVAGLAMKQPPCPAYAKDCHQVPPAGYLTFTCTGVKVSGKGASDTRVTCELVGLLMQPACSSESATSFGTSGRDLDLTTPGQLFKYDSATGRSTRVSAITGSGGLYTVVFGTCPAAAASGTIILPKTGGGLPIGPATPYGPITLAVIVSLALVTITTILRTKRI